MNPIEQDTLPEYSMHFSIGITSPNGIVSAGPQFSVSYEMLVVHPLIIRGGMDYNFGEMRSRQYPRGGLHANLLSLELLYYRGTDHLTGYIGGGALYASHWFSPFDHVSDSLMESERVTDVNFNGVFGYRLTLGLRFKKSYSLELGLFELYPAVVKQGITLENLESRTQANVKTGSFRLSIGYLVPI